MLQYLVGIVFLLPLLSAVIAQEEATKPADLDALVGADSPLQKNERIVFVGDSITMQGGFVELIDQAVRDKQSELEVKVTRHGLNGGRVPDMMAGKTPWGEMKPFAEILSEEKPTVLILYLGINDVMHSPGTSPAEFEQGLTELVKAAQQTGAVVVLATPAVNGENIDPESADQQKLDDYAKICRQVAETQSAALCDLRQAFVEHLQAHNPEHQHHGILTYDGVHMSDAGNRLIAEQMSEAIATAVRTRKAAE
ncbi:MAG: GDSL-type esterase/lipase family protein [Pirellulaceae bacterium]|nr:GDSL-type esterase/lipase family protein [Pirellulaceae bacterium]